MTVEFCNRGTKIEEEDFCHWTEKDVEFKCLEGLNAKLKKFYSWNKAILVQIEIDGTAFCGCLYQDNNSFAPVKFGPPKRLPLPCIMPSKPKLPKRKKVTETSSANAYSRENWPRVYIDPHNTVTERLRFGRDTNSSNNRSNNTPRIDKENSHHPPKKVGVLVYNNKRKKSSRCDPKSKNLAENFRLRRSERLHNSFSELHQSNVANCFKAEPNDKSSAIRLEHASLKGDKNVVKKSIGYKGKKCGAFSETSSLPKRNLRPRRANNGCKPKFINSNSESNDPYTSQYLLIDLTVSLTDCRTIQHPNDIFDKSIGINETSDVLPISQAIINPQNKEGNKMTIFSSDVLSPTLKEDKILQPKKNAKEGVNDVKSRSKKKKRKAFEKEFSDLSDKFEKMTIRAAAFGPPILQSSPKREFDSQCVQEEQNFKISGTEMQDLNSATADSEPTKRSSIFKF